MSKQTKVCPICGEANDCFEKCFDGMLTWYQHHYPHLMLEEEIFMVPQGEAKS